MDKRGIRVSSLNAICQEALSLEEYGVIAIDAYQGTILLCECPKGWTGLSTGECIPPDGYNYKFTVMVVD